VTSGSTLAAGAHAVTLTADEIDFDGGTDSVSGSGELTMQPRSSGFDINIGFAADSGSALDLTGADVDALAPGFERITIGNSDSDQVSIADAAFDDPLTLEGDQIIGGTLTVPELRLSAASGIDVATATPSGTPSLTLAAESAAGDVIVANAGDLTVGSVDGVDGVTAANGDVEIGAMSSIDIEDPIEAPAGSIRLNTPGVIRFGPDVDALVAHVDLELNKDIAIGDIEKPALATIVREDGGLTLTAETGAFTMGTGQKLSVVGDLVIEALNGTAAIGDLSAMNIEVDAGAISLLRRPAGQSLAPNGDPIDDGGVDYVANAISLSTPATAAAGPDAVTFSTQFGDPVANAPAGSFFATNKDGQEALATEDFIGTEGDAQGQVLDLVAGKVNPPPNPDTVPPLPEEVTLRTSLLNQINQVAAKRKPYWESEVVRAIECVMFEGMEPEEIPEECQEFVAVEEGKEVDPRMELEPLQNARQIYKEIFENEDDVIDALQQAADDYRAGVAANAVTGRGFRSFVDRDRSHAEAARYLERFSELFQAFDQLRGEAESGVGELQDQREDLVALFGPVGLTADEFNEAIESGAAGKQGEAARRLVASDGLPRSLRVTP
jgi:hypothetical protein